MNFRIADTFTASLARLTGDEQKTVKTTAFDLQMNPANPGLSFHKLDKARDKHFWSVRASRDIRLIVHKTEDSLLLCYVDHHDKAYEWAERRRLEVHPTTGAAQLVQLREREEVEVRIARSVSSPASARSSFLAGITDDELLSWGVPQDWLADVRGADEDSLLRIAAQLPAEAGEALLEFATGGRPEPRPVAPAQDPFEHPDAQRRFRSMADREALEQALDAPWDQWTVFLHPAQRDWVEKDQSGPARVSGTAGTGKTVVGVHRAVHLARAHPDHRVLLTTLNPSLARALHVRMRRLAGRTPQIGERIDVESLDAVAERLYRFAFGRPKLADARTVFDHIRQSISASGTATRLTAGFLLNEWQEVVDPWQLKEWRTYRDFQRLGRKTRLSTKQREEAWKIFDHVLHALSDGGYLTLSEVYWRLASYYVTGARRPFDHVVVDEAQDLSVPQLKLLSALAAGTPNGLFFAGDLGQRIFQLPFSWKSLGVDVRGRSRTLRVNYRTSHQIRGTADRLLGPEIADVDGNVEPRTGAVSVFNGPDPVVQTFPSADAEETAVAAWLARCAGDGLSADEMAVFVRTEGEFDRAQRAIAAAGLPCNVLDENVDTEHQAVALGTMHLAKGLEFKAVVVMACDDEVLPLQERIDAVTDEADLQEVYDTERHLLYVACTRARDQLFVTGVEPASEFLEDLNSPQLRRSK